MTDRPSPRFQSKREAVAIILLAVLQILCALVFLEELIVSVFGLRSFPISWTLREVVEILAACGLILGIVLGGLLIRAVMRQRRRAQDTLRAAAGQFQEMVEDEFDQWGLTPSERDVAYFMLKGFANSEIASLRQTSEGTIKAQATAVFRKAGVSGRPQLLSHFIEELLAGRGGDDSAGPDAVKRG